MAEFFKCSPESELPRGVSTIDSTLALRGGSARLEEVQAELMNRIKLDPLQQIHPDEVPDYRETGSAIYIVEDGIMTKHEG